MIKYSPATPGTFTSAGIADLPFRTRWAIITATNPKGATLSTEENARRQATLRGLLESLEFAFVPVFGRYGDPEEVQSFAVFKISHDMALCFGRVFGQESVLVPAGLLFCDDGRLLAPRGFEASTDRDDYYTRLPDGGKFAFIF